MSKAMTKQTKLEDKEPDFYDHIHMLGCQALTEARNLGFGEGKGEKTDDGDLMNMVEEHEKLLTDQIKQLISEIIGEDLDIPEEEKSTPELARENLRAEQRARAKKVGLL